MVDRKDLQEKILAYRILEARLDSLVKQRDLLANKILEIQISLNSIDEISKSNEEILFPIGSQAYAFGKVIEKNKLIVEIGAGVALEKNVGEAKEILNRRKKEIESGLGEVQKSVLEISAGLELLGPEINELVKEIEKDTKAG